MATNEPTTSTTASSCPSCSEVALDPCELPCKHLFCGPPRKCLEKIEISDGTGGFRCSMCKQEHKVTLNDLMKPTRKLQPPNCDNHKENNVSLGCFNCSELFCHECIKRHDGHHFSTFEYFTKERIRDALNSFITEEVTEDDLEQQIICSKAPVNRAALKLTELSESLSYAEQFLSNMEALKQAFVLIEDKQGEMEKFISGESEDIDGDMKKIALLFRKSALIKCSIIEPTTNFDFDASFELEGDKSCVLFSDYFVCGCVKFMIELQYIDGPHEGSLLYGLHCEHLDKGKQFELPFSYTLKICINELEEISVNNMEHNMFVANNCYKVTPLKSVAKTKYLSPHWFPIRTVNIQASIIMD